MKIIQMRLINIRSFSDTNRIRFSKKINIFTGFNNSGKSTVLKSLFHIQSPSFGATDIKIREKKAKLLLGISNVGTNFSKTGGAVNPENPEDENEYNFAFDIPANRIRFRNEGAWKY